MQEDFNNSFNNQDNQNNQNNQGYQSNQYNQYNQNNQNGTGEYSSQNNYGNAENENKSADPFSSYYTPPYYTPNYTSGTYTPQAEPEKKKPMALIVTVAVVAVLVISALAIIMLATISSLRNSYSGEVNLGKENLAVVKNSPQITLSENTDVDYVPQSIPEVVQKVGNSVVEISTSSVVTDRFFQQYVTSGAGSGVIITQSDEAGYLLTNHHVIDGASEIIVRLTSGEEYTAQVLGGDSSIDLALLRIVKHSNESFTVATIGDSKTLAVGQEIIAIGNPLGSLGGTVTNGIISALDRTVVVDGHSMVLLQHNAAINPGNSGGGLFDAMGNLIGIVNAKTSETGIEGLGFAIPIDVAYQFFTRIMITEPAIGIKVTYGKLNGVEGLYVTEVSSGSKFQEYDRIIAVDGKQIKSEADYYTALGGLKSGSSVTITVKRGYGTVDIVLNIT